jgi:hypothetical protein
MEAQSQPPGPVETMRAFWEAALSQRWADAVMLLDLGPIDRMRRQQLEMARLRPGREYTVEDLLRRDPDMPRAAAEYEVRRRERTRAEYPVKPFYMYAGVDSAAQLERMPLEEVAERWLRQHDVMAHLAEMRKRSNCPANPVFDSLMTTRRAVVYGAVLAGPDTAFVLHRPGWLPAIFGASELRDEIPPVAILIRHPEGWRIRATGDAFRGLSGGFGWDMVDCPARKP